MTLTKSIPISFVANVTPAVVAAGGVGVDVVGILLTSGALPPVGLAQSFVTDTAVGDYFGETSPEYAFAVQYFAGYDGSPQKPANLIVAQFPLVPTVPYLEGGTLATPLATLTQLAPATMTLELNGAPVVSSSINLSAATSYSQIAALVQAAFAYADAQVTASIATNVLTVTAVASGAIAPGQSVSNAGATIPPGVTIQSQLTGTTGGIGTYQLSQNVGTVASGAVSCGALSVSYSSQQDAFFVKMGTPGTAHSIAVSPDGELSTALKLTAATGAIPSTGSVPAVPGTFMDALVNGTTDWVTFTTLWEPTDALKEAFAAWNDAQNDRFAYVDWSTDTANDTNASAATGATYAIQQAGYDGVYIQYAPVSQYLAAAFIMGSAASIDFTKEGGRQNFAYLTSSTLPVDVTDNNVAKILKAKSVSFYGRFGGTKTTYNREAIGAVTGKFLWMDSYVNQVWLNDGLQTALAEVLFNTPNIPYTNEGYAIVTTGLADPIDAGLSFGAIQAGGTLSETQKSKVNSLAGLDVAGTIEQVGYALVLKPASAQVRAARGSPDILFFYFDGQSIQSLSLTSTEVQ